MVSTLSFTLIDTGAAMKPLLHRLTHHRHPLYAPVAALLLLGVCLFPSRLPAKGVLRKAADGPALPHTFPGSTEVGGPVINMGIDGPVHCLSLGDADGCVPPSESQLQEGAGVSNGFSFGAEQSAGPFDEKLNNCVGHFYQDDPGTGRHLVIKNKCLVAAHIFFYVSPQIHGGTHLKPGEVDNTYQSEEKIVAAGELWIYACPEGDLPRQADGTLAFNGPNNGFRCSRK